MEKDHDCKGHAHTKYLASVLDAKLTRLFSCTAMVYLTTGERHMLGPHTEEGEVNPVEVGIVQLRCCDDMAYVEAFNGDRWWACTLDLHPEYHRPEKLKPPMTIEEQAIFDRFSAESLGGNCRGLILW